VVPCRPDAVRRTFISQSVVLATARVRNDVDDPVSVNDDPSDTDAGTVIALPLMLMVSAKTSPVMIELAAASIVVLPGRTQCDALGWGVPQLYSVSPALRRPIDSQTMPLPDPAGTADDQPVGTPVEVAEIDGAEAPKN